MSTGEPIADAARIICQTEQLRSHLPRVLASARALSEACRVEPAAMRRRLDARLRALLRRAAGSPYWSRRMHEAGMTPRDITSLDGLRHLPTLDRATLGAAWQELPIVDPRAAWSRELFAVQSSGSTGQPITVVKDSYDGVHMWAVLRFWLARLGVALPPRPRVVLLCALPGGLEYASDLPLLDDGRLERISTVRPEPAARLLRADPHVLFSDPAGLHWLAANGSGLAPRLVLTSAQRFGASQREALARVLAAPVVDYYATSETGPIAWRCRVEAERLHVLTPDVWVESVGGELVVTRLRESALPLLRYRTGDSGVVEESACACGARGWSIRGFEGRRACWFVTEDGRLVDAWSVAWVLKYMDLKDFQLVQSGRSTFELRVVGGAPVVSPDRLVAALQRLGWRCAVVSVRQVEAIAQRGTKPEPFVSAL